MGEEIRGTLLQILCLHKHSNSLIDKQEAQAKYRESKAELDDLVANMEGL